MARPKKDEKKVQYTVMLEPTIIDEIKEIAKELNLPTGTFARKLIKSGLDDVRLLRKAGIVYLFGMGRRKIEEIKKKLNINNDE